MDANGYGRVDVDEVAYNMKGTSMNKLPAQIALPAGITPHEVLRMPDDNDGRGLQHDESSKVSACLSSAGVDGSLGDALAHKNAFHHQHNEVIRWVTLGMWMFLFGWSVRNTRTAMESLACPMLRAVPP